MAIDYDMFDEYYGGDDYTRTIVYDSISVSSYILREESPKGDLGKRETKHPEKVTGYWDEIINDEILNIKAVPEPPEPTANSICW